MMTGTKYKESLRDGRAVYVDGEKVDDLFTHATLGDCVRRTAADDDYCFRPQPDAVSPLMVIPRSSQDLRDTLPLQHEVGMLAHVTYTSLTTAAGKLGGHTAYAENIHEYVNEAARNDIRITHVLLTPKGIGACPRVGRTIRMPSCTSLIGAMTASSCGGRSSTSREFRWGTT